MENEYSKMFGKMISDRMKELRLTQINCAKRLNIQQSTLSQYINGKRAIDFDTAMEISKSLNLGMDAIFDKKAKDYVMDDIEYSIITDFRKLDPRKQQEFIFLMNSAFRLAKR